MNIIEHMDEHYKKMKILEEQLEGNKMEFKNDIPVELIDSMGGDETIAKAAWVSTKNGEEIQDPKKVPGVINYLMKNRHGTPFEHGTLTFRVHAPIFVWREWHRHRVGFSYNEESGRYKQLDPIFYIPSEDRPMFKIDDWKPGRPKFLMISSVEHRTKYINFITRQKELYKKCYQTYEENLLDGFDNGLARICLPVGIYSACWVTCNPRSMMHFLSLRTHHPEAFFVSYPLYEIQVAAEVCEKIFATGWPITYKAFCDNGRVAP